MDNTDTDHGHVYRSNNDKGKNNQSDQACDAPPYDEDAPCDLWDRLESDTESLVQEKAYQRELRKHPLSCDAEKWEHEEGCDPQPIITRKNRHLRPMSPSDEYADLRYDPDWRKKLQGSEFFQADISSDFNDSLRHAGHVYPRENQEYSIVPSPVSAELDAVHPKPTQSPFHLHPTQEQVTELPKSSPASLESTPRSDKPKNVKKSAARILPFSSSSQRQQDRETQNLTQDPDRDSLNVVATQRRHGEKVKPTRLREDIVERNKATLGMNLHKQGSYLKAYEQRGAKAEDAKRPLQSAEETASTDSAGSPDNALNPELMWIQKTEKLKTRNQSKHLDRVKPHHHRTTPRGHPKKQAEKQHLQPPSEKMGPLDSDGGPHSYSPAPTVNFKINLNTSATLAEPLNTLEPQRQLHTLAPSASPHWGTRNDECNSPFKGLSSTPGFPHQPADTVEHVHTQVANNISIRISPTRQERSILGAPQPEVHYEEDPAVVLQTYSGAYPLLPSIRVTNNSDPELCRGRADETLAIINRSSSEGYLAQLEKQNQLQAKTYTYKAYTLKDYKCLNRDVKLGGLGPTNIVAKDVAEKIRQQKLYSDVIREQNKKISRIPPLPTRSPVGRDDKNNIPRNKALEYAKTIAKPKAPQLKERPKDKHGSEKAFESSASLQLKADLTYLSTIEMLRKRHEREKQVVAGFTNIHSKLTTSFISSH